MSGREPQIEVGDREVAGDGPRGEAGIHEGADERPAGGLKGPAPRVFSDRNYERAKKSTRHERRVAQSLGAKRLPRSGGRSWSKYDSTTDGGDLTGSQLHIEHKRVEPQTKAIRVPREWLAKVSEGAHRRALTPGLVVTFEEPKGHVGDWLMLPLDVAVRLLGVREVEEGE